MLDVARRNDGVDAFGDAVLQAARGIARTVAQQQIGDRAIAVVDDGDLLGEIVAALNVGRKDKPGGAEKCIRSADVLIECSPLRKHQARSGNVPHVCCGGDKSIRGSVVHAGAQIPRIGEVERLVGVPDHGSSSRGEVRRPRNPTRSSRPRRRRGSKPAERDRQNNSQRQQIAAESDSVDRSAITEQHAAPSAQFCHVSVNIPITAFTEACCAGTEASLALALSNAGLIATRPLIELDAIPCAASWP